MWRWRSLSTSSVSAGRDPCACFVPLCPSSKSNPVSSHCMWDKDALGEPWLCWDPTRLSLYGGLLVLPLLSSRLHHVLAACSPQQQGCTVLCGQVPCALCRAGAALAL